MKNKNGMKQMFQNNLYIMRFAAKLCRARVLLTGVSLGLTIFSSVFFNTYFLRDIVAMLESKADLEVVARYLLFVTLLYLVVHVFTGWYDNCLKPVSETEVYKGLYKTLYHKARSVEMGCFEDSDFYNNYILAMEKCDVRLLQTIDNMWNIIIRVVAVAVTWSIMISLDPYLIFFVLGPIIGNFFFAERLNRLSFKLYEESAIFKRIADYVNRVMHLNDYAKEIRMTNIFQVMKRKQEDAVKGMTDTIDKYAKTSICYGWGYLFFTFSLIFEGSIFYGAYRTIYCKAMSMAEFVMLCSMMTSVSFNLIYLVEALLASFKNSLYIQKLRDFLEYEPTISEDTDGIMPDREIREICFENVSFCYKKESPVLKNISFTVSAKESCALVGYNGAGKSTLIKLLLRFYDPTEGRILVNGIDIRRYNLKAYRTLFATAFQDGKIFARSIADNVWMGRNKEENTDSRVMESLMHAGIMDRVNKLPKNVNTIMTKEFDEEGVVLSGGQNQKILAARAFAKVTGMNCPIMVFDEPSSALDPIAESELMESIKTIGKEHVLFLISHRLSAMHDMDKIMLLKNGHLAEKGTHQELMKANGEYALLYHMQAQKYQEGEAYEANI